MIEDVVTDMKRLLELYADEQLQRQDAKFLDGIILESIRQIQTGDESITEQGLPIVIIKGESTAVEMYATSKKDVLHTIQVQVVVSDTKESVSQKKLWRTMRAVENVFEIYGPAYGSILDYETTSQEFNVSLFELEESKSTEKGGIITATVRERQDAYISTQL